MTCGSGGSPIAPQLGVDYTTSVEPFPFISASRTVV